VLDKLKELLTKAPTLVPSAKKVPLLLYITTTTRVLSVALVVEWEEVGHALKLQRPIYIIGKVLDDSKIHCP
jgi:hypothetical protein